MTGFRLTGTDVAVIAALRAAGSPLKAPALSQALGVPEDRMRRGLRILARLGVLERVPVGRNSYGYRVAEKYQPEGSGGASLIELGGLRRGG